MISLFLLPHLLCKWCVHCDMSCIGFMFLITMALRLLFSNETLLPSIYDHTTVVLKMLLMDY